MIHAFGLFTRVCCRGSRCEPLVRLLLVRYWVAFFVGVRAIAGLLSLNQRWTLSRIKTVIGWRIHKSCTLQGVRKLLIRHGFSCQVPARRAVERGEEAICGWVKETWPHVDAPRRRSMPGSSSRTKPASR
ncbi:helix-turn-helix domain-containing protein [Streptomyces chartreusis]